MLEEIRSDREPREQTTFFVFPTMLSSVPKGRLSSPSLKNFLESGVYLAFSGSHTVFLITRTLGRDEPVNLHSRTQQINEKLRESPRIPFTFLSHVIYQRE